MSLSEVGFRLRRKIVNSVERIGVGRAKPAQPVGRCGEPWLAHLPRRFDTQRYARAADRILEGWFDVFALRGAALGFPPRWNVDPKTGIEAPLQFGKDLNYRDPEIVGDVKYLWEVNRHLELVTLAQAWHLTADERYAQGCKALLESWFGQCPYPRGVNWCASLEHAVRLVNWSFAWFLLGSQESRLFAGEPGRAFRQRWLTCIYQHCHFIASHWSRYSSANNHLLGEATGLFVAAVTWPLWEESARWRDAARSELTREALAQTFSDGVNKEQATWYHHAVADMLLLSGLVARANSCDFGAEYWARLQAMLEFIASVMDVGGNVPAFGDADEGVLVRFVPGRPANVFGSLLATGAVLFGRPQLHAKAAGFDDKSRWLLGDGAESRFKALEASQVTLPVRRAFPDGGYYILGEHFETPREVRVVADAGPLGYLSIAAHGHADALSFTLSVSGKPILIDSGTYSYRADGAWRRYFRGTLAHNTLTVDGESQSVFGGAFLWLEHAGTAVDAFEIGPDVQHLSAHHDGYRRLPDPVRHRRTWRYHPGAAQLTVSDELLCAGAHALQLCWHFSPECYVTRHGDSVVAERAGVRLRLTCSRRLALQLASGREHPPLGWFSPAVDVKVPAPTAVFAGEIRGDTALRTDIQIEFV